MTCENCDCEISEGLQELQPLFAKLAKARFSGRLHLVFEAGGISSAKLEHYLSYEALGKNLPVIEPEEEFALKP